MVTVADNTSDVFAAEVRCHKSCWKNYTRPVGLLCDDNQNSYIHNVECRNTCSKTIVLKTCTKGYS